MLSDYNLNLLRIQYKVGSQLKLFPQNVVEGKDKQHWTLQVKSGADLYLTLFNMIFSFLSHILLMSYAFHSMFRSEATFRDIILAAYLILLMSYTLSIYAFQILYFNDIPCVINEMVKLSYRGKM